MYLPKDDWFQNVRAESYCYHNRILGTWYLVLCTIKVRNTGLKISNAERRILNEEEKHPTITRILYFTELARSISIVFQFYLKSKLLGTLYFVLGTIKVRNTGLKISNAERRILNEEEKTSDYKNTILGTWYLVLRTSYKQFSNYV